MKEKITFQQLAELLSVSTGGSQATTEAFLKELFSIISNAIENGEKATIKGIGSFMLSMDNSDLEYAPDKDLAESINMPFSCFEAVEIDDDTPDLNIDTIDLTITDSENFNLEQRSNINASVASEKDSKSEPEPEPKTGIEAELQPDAHNQEITDDNSGSDADAEAEETSTVISQDNPDQDTVLATPEIHKTIDESNTETCTDTESDYNEPTTPSSKPRFTLGIILGFILGFLCATAILHTKPDILLWAHDDTELTPINEPSDSIIDSSTVNPNDSIDNDSIVTVSEFDEIIAIDTVKTTRFLTTMARQYYNEMMFWVYIYEENKDKLGNPNTIKPGTTVAIPDLRKYGIHNSDSVNLERAKLKAVEIYAPYQK